MEMYCGEEYLDPCLLLAPQSISSFTTPIFAMLGPSTPLASHHDVSGEHGGKKLKVGRVHSSRKEARSGMSPPHQQEVV